MPSNSNCYGLNARYTFYPPRRPGVLISSSHYDRRKLWMTATLFPRKRSILIFYLYLLTRRARHLLRVLHIHGNVKHWRSAPSMCDSRGIYRVCATLRANKILRRYRDYKPFIRDSLHWSSPGGVNMRRLCSRQRYPQPLFCPSFSYSVCYRCPYPHTLTVFTSNRVQQPPGIEFKYK